MKIKSKASISGMSSAMLAAILGTLILCVFSVFMLESDRTLPGDFDSLETRIQDAQYMVGEFTAAPVLPPLETSWRQVKALLMVHGLELVPEPESTNGGSAPMYEGPLKSWRGFVKGNSRLVFAAIQKVQTESPVYLLDYSVREGKTQIYIAVVGI